MRQRGGRSIGDSRRGELIGNFLRDERGQLGPGRQLEARLDDADRMLREQTGAGRMRAGRTRDPEQLFDKAMSELRQQQLRRQQQTVTTPADPYGGEKAPKWGLTSRTACSTAAWTART